MSDELDQRTMRFLYDAFRARFQTLVSAPVSGLSPTYDAGVRKGFDMAIDLLAEVNGGAPAPAESGEQPK